MVELTNAQEEILDSLRQAVRNGNFQEVQNVLDNNEHNDIQAVLSHEWTLTSDKGTILDFVMCCSITIKAQVEIIEQIWKEADQKTRDFLCNTEYDLARGDSVNTINMLRGLQERTNDSNNGPVLGKVIQEMEEHKRVMDLGSNLEEAIENLDIDQVKAALENCGENAARVLELGVYWNDGSIDALLVCPLLTNYDRELNQEDVEKIKESFKLMFDAASPGLLGFEPNGNNYVMSKLVRAQKYLAKIPGVGEQCFQDLIQEFEEKLSKDTLDNAKTDDQIAWDKAYATRFSQEINHDLFENDEFNAFMDDTDLGQDTENSALTADNKTPEKNETTFWSEHKGKISLGVGGLCAVGAVAAYVLAYPAVALALTVLAAVILIGAGIAKVCEKSESPNTKSSDPVVSEYCNNAKSC
ncbi:MULTISPECIES: hypothetical protein [unclassified Wolbachia]|uniref:hypothetical protein n=1 Tax=unclassified Wolbachia TaxID=2640676 RepID=UPI0007EEDDB4|nr:hypothetical protein [Wolbachia endosymbiont of Nomada ferruginata]